MKSLNTYITEKYKLTKNAANSYVYICFINDIDLLQYRICYSREKLINWLDNGTYRYIRFIIKAKSVYEEDIIKKEEERIEKVKKTNNSNKVIDANSEAQKWLESIDAEKICGNNTTETINLVKDNKDF